MDLKKARGNVDPCCLKGCKIGTTGAGVHGRMAIANETR